MELRIKTDRYRILWLCCLIASLGFISSSTFAYGDVLDGKVIQVSGKTVKIKLDSDLIPQKGDAVSISFEVPGVGAVPLKGKWRVTRVGQDSITADPSGDTAQPKKGQKATIQSENPQSADTLKEEAEAIYGQAEDYYKGQNGVEKDYAKAVCFYRRAAELGYAKGECSLGYMYATGKGVEKDYHEGISWFQKAANQGYAEGQHNLGMMYDKGWGVSQNKTRAIEWYLKAARQGYDSAQFSLGIMHEKAQGVPRDYARAFTWYRQAADQGNVKAQTNLGGMYYRGRGVVKDYKTALYWFKKAAEKDHSTAQSNLGVMYENGQGVSKNKVVAIEWYRKAARQGYTPAQENLKRLGVDW